MDKIVAKQHATVLMSHHSHLETAHERTAFLRTVHPEIRREMMAMIERDERCMSEFERPTMRTRVQWVLDSLGAGLE